MLNPESIAVGVELEAYMVQKSGNPLGVDIDDLDRLCTKIEGMSYEQNVNPELVGPLGFGTNNCPSIIEIRNRGKFIKIGKALTDLGQVRGQVISHLQESCKDFDILCFDSFYPYQNFRRTIGVSENVGMHINLDMELVHREIRKIVGSVYEDQAIDNFVRLFSHNISDIAQIFCKSKRLNNLIKGAKDLVVKPHEQSKRGGVKYTASQGRLEVATPDTTEDPQVVRSAIEYCKRALVASLRTFDPEREYFPVTPDQIMRRNISSYELLQVLS